MNERRKFTRIPFSSGVTYELSNAPKTKTSIGKNISRGGVCFYSHEFILKESVLKINFTLKKYPYGAFVKVAWVREDAANDRYEVGTEFIETKKVDD